MNNSTAILKRRIIKTVKYVSLSLWAVVTLFPLYWTFVNSFRTNNQIFTKFAWFPEDITYLENYKSMMQNDVLLAFFNSTTITAITMALLLICAILLAYVLSVYRFKYAAAIHSFFTIGVVIPRLSVLIATYMNFKTLGLLGHRYSLVFCYAAFEIPMAVYLLVGYMKSLPAEVFESGIIDGCSSWTLLTKIVLPMSKNGILTVVIISFVNVWNDYLYARVFLTNNKFLTVTTMIASAKTEFFTDYGMQMAGVILAVAPIIFVYMFLQDKIIDGMAAGAVKG